MSRFDVWRPGTHEPLAPPVLDADKCARAEDTLTWQQREDLSKNKSRRRTGRAAKFVPLDLEALAEPQASVKSHAEPFEHLQARDAAPEGPDKPRVGDQPPKSAQASQPHDVSAKNPRSSRNKRKPKNTQKPRNMVARTPLTGPYVPPHLRKRTAAAGSTNDVRLGNHIALDSPQTSDKSQLEKLAAEASSTQVLSQQQTPLSPPKTVEGSPPNANAEASPTHAIAQKQIPATPPSNAVAGPSKNWNDSWSPFKNRNDSWDNTLNPEPSSTPVIPPKRPCKRWMKDDGWEWDHTLKPEPEPKRKGKHVWVKTRDIPRKAPTQSTADGGGIDFESDSDGDVDYDIKKLMDWEGQWMPPPEDWAARKGFNPRHFRQGVEQWINGHSRNCIKPMDINCPDFKGVLVGTDKQGRNTFLTKDVVPRYWFHDSIDNAAPRKFWSEYPQRSPSPLTDVDIFEHPPYWERWEDDKPEHCYMLPLAVPEATVNVDDPENAHHPYAMISTADRVQKIAEMNEARRRKKDAKLKRAMLITVPEVVESPDRLSPRANVYLRPVQQSDVRGIMTIYNHYVKNTVYAEEVEEQTEVQIRDWIGDIVKAGLPCFVAVAKRSQRKKPGAANMSETIAGWIHLEPYSAGPMHRFSSELALYVHPGYVRQGIGKCLLDQLMEYADTSYHKKGGYEYINNFEYLNTGALRILKTITVRMHYESDQDADWATSYFGDYGFKRAGRFYEIGHKNGKVVHVVMFQRHTSEKIDPRSVPKLD